MVSLYLRAALQLPEYEKSDGETSWQNLSFQASVHALLITTWAGSH